MEHDNIQNENNTNPATKNNLAVPIAIVIAGALIAGAVYLGGRGDTTGITSPTEAQQEQAQLSASLNNMAPITSADHIRGNPNAPVKIVEYSDMECPFCKRFHPTMQQTVDEYDGKVAWVYRHFPLDSIHSKARSEAIATECAGELGGNDMFW
jgi:protein-disulfide isomerase